MPFEITMPQLSDTMSEGTVVKWLKKEGDKVRAGETIAEVETDKATMEMESFEAGTLALIDAKEGTKVKVGQRIGVLASAGETVDQVKKQLSGKAPAASTSAGGQKPPASAAAAGGEGDSRSQPALQRTAAVATAAPPMAQSQEKTNDGGRMRVSPLARRMAADRGVELNRVQGSGPGGRIVQRDIETALNAPATSGAAAAPLAARVGSGQKQVVQLTKMRATIAQRLQQSKQQIPHFYETVDIDIEELVSIRAGINKQLEKEKIHLSLGDFITKGIATALVRHPQLNAHFSGTQVTRFGDVHLGMAVALEDGLIVPVLRNVNQMGIKEIRQRSEDLIDRARKQKLRGDELSGGTFTVSNLGTYGVKEFSAIINPPEVGILAIGAAEKRPAVRDGAIVARTLMSVTLSADHRAVDGASAAEFLRTLKELLQEPGMMLM